MRRLILVGDSDIAFWPKDLLPSPTNDSAKGANNTDWGQPVVSGHSGATLAGVLPHLRRTLAIESRIDYTNGVGGRNTTRNPMSTQDTTSVIVVACAGENDIGEGLSLRKSTEALREFADAIFLEHPDNDNVHLIFLGPKFEPWLEDDPSYKKKYTAMTMAFRRCLEDEYDVTTRANHEHSIKARSEHSVARKNNVGNPNEHTNNPSRIHFIDSLTMFCGDTANVPGARLGGRAKADPQYFATDGLHLSNKGYKIWKEVVEDRIHQCIAA